MPRLSCTCEQRNNAAMALEEETGIRDEPTTCLAVIPTATRSVSQEAEDMATRWSLQPELWTGVALSVGAGLGAALGVLLAGGPGIAIGAAMGAGLGVVAAAVGQAWDKDRAGREPSSGARSPGRAGGDDDPHG